MPHEPLDGWLEQLGSAAPTPGGGAAAALAAAAGAALESAAINVEVNLGSIRDEAVRDALRKELSAHLIAQELGREVVGNVLHGVRG